MRLTKTAGWSLATALLCVVLLVAAWFLLIEPQRAAATETRTQTESVRQQNLQLAARIDQLRVEFANLPARQAELQGIRQALPDVALLDDLLAEISTAALAAPVRLDSITTSEPVALLDDTGGTPVAADTTAAAAVPADGGTNAGGTTDGGTTGGGATPAPGQPGGIAAPAPDGSAPGQPAAGAADAAVVPGVPVLAAIPVSLSSTGDYFSIAAFLKTLQTGIDRALIIDTVSVDMATADASSGTAGDEVSVSITGRVFVFVDPDSTPTTAPPTTAPPTTASPTTASPTTAPGTTTPGTTSTGTAIGGTP